MGRKRKNTTEELIQIVDQYYVACNGNFMKFNASHIAEYANTQGHKVQYYDFCRNTTVKQYIDEVKNKVNQMKVESHEVAYKDMDIDEFLRINNTKERLKKALILLEEKWKYSYELLIDSNKKYKKLGKENSKIKSEYEKICNELEEAIAEGKKLKIKLRDGQREIRYLKKMLETYLYPAIANEILKQEGVLREIDTEIPKKTVEAISEVNSDEIEPVINIINRTEKLFAEDILSDMWKNIED